MTSYRCGILVGLDPFLTGTLETPQKSVSTLAMRTPFIDVVLFVLQHTAKKFSCRLDCYRSSNHVLVPAVEISCTSTWFNVLLPVFVLEIQAGSRY
jgi:hypothetical protein